LRCYISGRRRTIALVLAVAGTVYLISTRQTSSPLQPPPPVAEIRPDAPTATDPIEPSVLTRELEESIPDAQTSDEERAAVVKHTLTLTMGSYRDRVVEQLVAQGLSPTDAEQIAQRFIEGFSDCLFEAARRDSDAQGRGLKEFLEMSWTQTMAYISLNRVRSAAAPCVANISQQTGISLPAEFGSSGSRDETISPPPPRPLWASDMESRVRDHIASHPELAVTGVFVDCVENGCNVMIAGRDIRIFDLEFDVFAEQNGFKRTVLHGDSNSRFVWLER